MKRTAWVCPNCGSTDIGRDSSSVLSMVGLDHSRECRDCGYTGIFPEVDRDKVRDQQHEIRKRGKIADAGKNAAPSRSRLYIGLLFLLVGIPSSLYATWRTGRLAGLLALAVGAAVLFEYISHRS